MHLKKLSFCHERMAKALRTLDEFTFISCCGFPIFRLFCFFFSKSTKHNVIRPAVEHLIQSRSNKLG